MPNLLHWLIQSARHLISCLERALVHLTPPARHSLFLSTATDLTRSRIDLIGENALLRQQLMILDRNVKKPRPTPSDHLWLVLLASRVHRWKDILLLRKLDTLLRCHRQGFRLFWKFQSRTRGGRPRISTETIAVIQRMANENIW